MVEASSTRAADADRASHDALPRVLARRRRLVLLLNLATVAALAAMMLAVLAAGGLSAAEVVVAAAFVVTLPWLAIGFWNAIIGAVLVARGPRDDDPLALVDDGGPIAGRTALVMAIRNEVPDAPLARLRAMFEGVVASGLGDRFDVHILSDTNDPRIAAAEARMVAAWRADSARGDQIHYRRRKDNAGFKAGNLREFVLRCGDRYAFFLPLDADSTVEPHLVARLVRIMERQPHIGILQTLAVGMPSGAFFTRVFQFGMRHGMRTYTAGAVWWSGDCGPYWGHNALIRTAPFRDGCALPELPGGGPLGGAIMSHDQVEAALMRRAGYHVRVLVEEGGSYEENPPTLPDFIRRELRWCQGNMQYLRLLGMPGLRPVSRVQLALAVLMYVGAPAWILFMVAGALGSIGGGVSVPGTAAAPVPGLGWLLLAAVLAMTFAPKLLGLAGVLASGRQAARYGGRVRVAVGGVVEIVCSMLMAPVVAFALAVFCAGLALGRTIDWRAQPRDARTVTWGEAARTFLPQTAFGLALALVLGLAMPEVLPIALPALAGLVLAVPFAVLTSDPRLGRLAVRLRLCEVPADGCERAGATTRPTADRRLDPPPDAAADNGSAAVAPDAGTAAGPLRPLPRPSEAPASG